jgi:hypothetical protein
MSSRDGARCIEIQAYNGFIRTPTWLHNDPRLSLADRSIWQTVAMIEYREQHCDENLNVIAAISHVSQRQARRSIPYLIELGFLSRTRSPRRNNPDRLATIKLPAAPFNPRPIDKCPRCSVLSPLTSAGVCGRCVAQLRAEREITDALAALPPDSSLDRVFVRLRRNGSKCSARDIRTAYFKITGRATV